MRLRLQIVYSFVAHAAIIVTALAVGRDWTLPVPAEPMTISLVGGLPEISALNAQDSKKKVMHRTSALPARDRPVKDPHDYSAFAGDKTFTAAGPGERHLISTAGENTSEERSPKEPLKWGSGTQGTSPQSLPSSFPAAGYQGLPAGISASAGLDHQQIKTQTGGKNTVDVMAIRKAIEKALLYPLFAKKRGLEGTVLTEFTVNAKGYPEDISIIESSGYNILDRAAKEALLKSAPFAAGIGRYEIPITFRLKNN